MFILPELKNTKHDFYLYSFSALDKYYKISNPYVYRIITNAGIIDLVKIFEDISFPGADDCDALLEHNGVYYLFKTDTEIKDLENNISVLNFYYSIKENKFIDVFSAYKEIKRKQINDKIIINDLKTLKDSAVLLSKYNFNFEYDLKTPLSFKTESPFDQKILLFDFLDGLFPDRALALLLEASYIEKLWPEIYELQNAAHSKEYHPEGENAWSHTLETFKYRKNANMLISLGLLLHDLGKPDSDEQDGKKFYRHAQIGSYSARKFLEKLEFPESLIRAIVYLVKNHMLAGAVSTLPAYKTEEIMSNEIFPLLLELFRCDLLSTFRGPEAYYNACKKYKSFLKNKKNPFRNTEGKKFVKLYVE